MDYLITLGPGGNGAYTYGLVFVVSFFFTILFTWLFLKLARLMDFQAHPGEHKIHAEPTPYLGGPAVLFGCFLSLFLVVNGGVIAKFFLACFLVAVIGLVDDYYDVPATLKLIVLAAAVFLSAQVGISSNFFPDTWAGGIGDMVLTLFWAVLVISAFNAADNMDGLAPGFAAIACFMFFIIGGIQFHQPQWAMLSLSMSGALVGFLLFNFHPAVIFLGDSGSFFLGFFLAMLSVMGQWSNHPVKSVIIPFVILSVPILDLIFVVIYRYLTGVTDSIRGSIEYSGQDHLSHRIQQAQNFGIRRTVLILYTLAFLVGLLGVIMRNTLPLEAMIALVIAGFLYFLVMLLILPNAAKIYWRWQQK